MSGTCTPASFGGVLDTSSAMVVFCPPYESCKALGSAPASEQDLRDLDGIRRRPLPVALDAVGGEVMQQRGAMHRRIETVHAGRAGVNQ